MTPRSAICDAMEHGARFYSASDVVGILGVVLNLHPELITRGEIYCPLLDGNGPRIVWRPQRRLGALPWIALGVGAGRLR